MEKVILFHSTMMNKYDKLVAISREMATSWNKDGLSVDGMSVQVEENYGVIRLGHYDIVGCNYSPDENVVMPEYGVAYRNYVYRWVAEEWVREETRVEVKLPAEEDWTDDLPF